MQPSKPTSNTHRPTCMNQTPILSLDGRGLRRLLRREHRSLRAITGRRFHERAPLEDHALVDLQAGRMDVAFDAAGCVDLDRPLRRDVADDGALNDHLADIDLRLDLRTFTDHERVIGKDLAFEATIDPDRAFERKLAFE